MAPDPLVERAADGLLMLFERVETADVSEPADVEIGWLMSERVAAAMPTLTAYITRAHNRMRERDVRFGFDTAVDALVPAGGAHAVLAARLLAWSAKRTGLSYAEVVAEVFAHTDVEEAD